MRFYFLVYLITFFIFAVAHASQQPAHFRKGIIAYESIVAGASTGETAAASAIVDMKGTTKGLLPPRLTTTQRDAISSPDQGLVIYNTTEERLDKYNSTSSAWQPVAISGYTAGRALHTNADGEIVVSAVSSVELNYMDTVSSNVQTQLNTKVQGKGSGSDNKVPLWNGTDALDSSSTSETVLGYINSLTSNAQTQIDSKQAASLSAEGDLFVYLNSSTGRLPRGAEDQVLTMESSIPKWKASAAGFANPMNAEGDLIVYAGGSTGKLARGVPGSVLSMPYDSSIAVWSNSYVRTPNVTGIAMCNGFITVAAGTPTITRGTDCLDSVTDNAPGDWSLNFKPITFTGVADCFLSVFRDGGLSRCGHQEGTPSANAVDVIIDDCDDSENDNSYSFLCIGVR